MRYVFLVLAVLMLLAVAVQYNDPDGPLWMVYYGVPAVWCVLAAFKPHVLASRPARLLLAASAVAALGLTIVYWPPVAGFWHEQVWEMGKTDAQAAADRRAGARRHGPDDRDRGVARGCAVEPFARAASATRG